MAQESYYANFTKAKGVPVTGADKKRLLTDRSAYISFLEVQLERVTAAVLTAQGFSDRIDDQQRSVTAAHTKIVNLTKLVQLAQTYSEKLGAETSASVQSAKAATAALATQYEGVAHAVAALRAKAASASEAAAGQAASLASLQSTVDSLQGALTARDGAMDALNGRLSEATATFAPISAVRAVQNQAAAAARDADAAVASSESAAQEAVAAREAAESAAGRAGAAESAASRAQGQAAGAAAEAQSALDTAQRAQSAVEGLTPQVTGAASVADRALTRASDLQTSLASLRGHVEGVEGELRAGLRGCVVAGDFLPLLRQGLREEGLAGEVDAARRAATVASEAVGEVQGALAAARAEAAGEAAGVRAEVGRLRGALAEKDDVIAGLEARLATLESRVAGGTSTAEAALDAAAAATASVKECAERVGQLEGAAAEADAATQGALGGLEEGLAGVEERCTSVEGAVEELLEGGCRGGAPASPRPPPPPSAALQAVQDTQASIVRRLAGLEEAVHRVGQRVQPRQAGVPPPPHYAAAAVVTAAMGSSTAVPPATVGFSGSSVGSTVSTASTAATSSTAPSPSTGGQGGVLAMLAAQREVINALTQEVQELQQRLVHVQEQAEGGVADALARSTAAEAAARALADDALARSSGNAQVVLSALKTMEARVSSRLSSAAPEALRKLVGREVDTAVGPLAATCAALRSTQQRLSAAHEDVAGRLASAEEGLAVLQRSAASSPDGASGTVMSTAARESVVGDVLARVQSSVSAAEARLAREVSSAMAAWDSKQRASVASLEATVQGNSQRLQHGLTQMDGAVALCHRIAADVHTAPRRASRTVQATATPPRVERHTTPVAGGHNFLPPAGSPPGASLRRAKPPPHPRPPPGTFTTAAASAGRPHVEVQPIKGPLKVPTTTPRSPSPPLIGPAALSDLLAAASSDAGSTHSGTSRRSASSAPTAPRSKAKGTAKARRVVSSASSRRSKGAGVASGKVGRGK